MEITDLYKISLKLALSLIIGILFGIERDLKRFRKYEDEEEGTTHFGGIRTFALIGLLGGLCGYIGTLLNHPVYIYGFLAVAFFVIASYTIEHRKGGKLGMTTEFSALLTYTLGTLSVIGHIQVVIAITIACLFLLSQKRTVKTWGAKLKPGELLASLKFALVLLVIFPFLRDVEPIVWRGVTLLDPFRIWKMVVLVSSISYFGYFLTRVFGQERGNIVSGIVGGIASSTAVTHDMASKSSKIKDKNIRASLISATLFANGVSFLRGLAIIAILNLSFFEAALIPLCVMSLVCFAPALFIVWSHRKLQRRGVTEVELESPFSLKPALIFGLVFALVLLFVQLFRDFAGDAGLYLFSIISGFPDLDAIAITLAGMAGSQIIMKIAVLALVLAISSNLIFKTIIARMGGIYFWKRITITLVITLVTGVLVASAFFFV
jgi:uncharacterized membrane protein (DUF4010 family)